MHRYTLLIRVVHLLLYVRPVLEILLESADVAGYLLPGFEAEGDDRNETEGEPFPVAMHQPSSLDRRIVRSSDSRIRLTRTW
jgi:hypothetical protein